MRRGQVDRARPDIAACSGEIIRWYSTLAFLPVLARGFAWFAVEPEPLAIHALGKSELAYAYVFGILMVVGMPLTCPRLLYQPELEFTARS
jgi:hypothetical protein